MLLRLLHCSPTAIRRDNFLQTQRVDPIGRIRHVVIEVEPTTVANRILADKPSDPWIIVPMAVVVQAGFGVVVLALEADRVF